MQKNEKELLKRIFHSQKNDMESEEEANMTEETNVQNDSPKSTEDVVNFLNSLLALDSEAINKLFSVRVSCNESIQNHPSVQVNENGEVGVIGVLNGLFGIRANGSGNIAYELTFEGDEPPDNIEDMVITKFILLDKEANKKETNDERD